MTDILKIKQNNQWVSIPAIKGETGEGVIAGGTTGQVLKKKTNTDYDTEWGTVDALPSQSGQSGKYLTTNGSSASWATVSQPTKISDLTDDTATYPIDKADKATQDASGNVITTTYATKSELYHPPLLSATWADHLLDNLSWLRADTFSWQNGTTYSIAYNELVTEYNNASSTTETEGSITFKRTPKGYKIADATQETAILNKYNTDGIAWYYILDTANTRFKLPRTKFGFEGLRGNVGNDIAESLPNISGSFDSGYYGVYADGSFTASSSTIGYDIGTWGTVTANFRKTLNASNSSSTYQDNAPVQERATQMYLYFYVGEYAQTAIEQTAGITSEQLNAKLDLQGATTATTVDGQWVDITKTTILNTSSSSSGSIDISSYLPSDSYKYEVVLIFSLNTPTASYTRGTCNITNKNNTTVYSEITLMTGNGYAEVRSGNIVPIDTDKKVYYQIAFGGGTFTTEIEISAYRRIGTNQ